MRDTAILGRDNHTVVDYAFPLSDIDFATVNDTSRVRLASEQQQILSIAEHISSDPIVVTGRDLVNAKATIQGPENTMSHYIDYSEDSPRDQTINLDIDTKKDRPVSVISTASTDVGLGLDLLGEERTDKQMSERPISMVSTASADTGIYSEHGDTVKVLSSDQPGFDMDNGANGESRIDGYEEVIPPSESTFVEDNMDTESVTLDEDLEVKETPHVQEEERLADVCESKKRSEADNERQEIEEKHGSDTSDEPPVTQEEQCAVQVGPPSKSKGESLMEADDTGSEHVAHTTQSEQCEQVHAMDAGKTIETDINAGGDNQSNLTTIVTSRAINVDAVILEFSENNEESMTTEKTDRVENILLSDNMDNSIDAENCNVALESVHMPRNLTNNNNENILAHSLSEGHVVECTAVDICNDYNIDDALTVYAPACAHIELSGVPPPDRDVEVQCVHDVDMLDTSHSDEKVHELEASSEPAPPSMAQECMDVEPQIEIAPGFNTVQEAPGAIASDVLVEKRGDIVDNGDKVKNSTKESPKKSASTNAPDKSTKIKRPSLLSRNNSYKVDTASAKSVQSRVSTSSQFKRPANPISAKSSLSSNPASKTQPTDSKITKRKTDTSANAVPSKKAAGSIHSKKSSNLKVDFNSAANSGDEGVKSGVKKSPIVKSRLMNPSARKGSVDDAKPTTSKSSARGRLSLPGVTGLRKPGLDGGDAGSTNKLGTRSTGLRKPSAGPTSSLLTPRPSSGPAQVSRLKIVTSTPKPGGQPIRDAPPPDVSVLHASDDSGTSSHRNASKPGNRVAQNLQNRMRTRSIGSDSQVTRSTCSSRNKGISVTSSTSATSRLSAMSSQGSVATRKRKSFGGTASAETVSSTVSRRRSLLPPKSSDASEPKKPGLSVGGSSGRLGVKPKTPTAVTQLKKPTNQNKHKPLGTSTPRTPPRGVKRLSVADQHAEEISRLEALCESRTKELNYAKMQLKQSAAGFEAMSVLVNYLTQGLDAFACPDVKRQLQETKDRLENAHVQLAELMTQRDALIEEIKCMKERHATEIDGLTERHCTTLSSTEARFTKQNEQDMAKLKEDHSKEVSALKISHEKSMGDMAQAHDSLIKMKEREHEDDLVQHKHHSLAHIADLQQQHEHALGDITKRFENIKMTLSEKVDHLRAESEAMRRREQQYLTSYKADSDMKVSLAVQPFKHLPQEIESLKAVIEMRNQEIHDLRRKNVECEKLLEDLPRTKEKVIHLEQKNENLEAVIKIKADYERQLSEKHSVLIRRCDRESKANKRLSMDKEELEWRLSQDSTGLAELLNRSISHSPPSSSASTPEPTRRRKSPLPQQSPRSPRGGIAMEFFESKSPRSNGTNVLHRKQVKSGDFDRPVFSPRHSSADLYVSAARRDHTMTDVFEVEHAHDDSIMSASTQSEPSTNNPNPVKSNLKRSGTYDLLNEEFEMCEESPRADNLKQTDV